MKNPIIFLDFDGTTLPLYFEKALAQLALLSQGQLKAKDQYGMYFHPACMDNLKKLVEKFAADIVITSTWKNTMGLASLQEMWRARGYAGKVVGVTLQQADLNRRGLEIQNYLQVNPSISRYVIIDDMGTDFFENDHLPFLVRCDPNFGFTKSKLEEACRILGG